MRAKKPTVSSTKSKRFANAIGAGVIGLAAVCVVATAIMIAARQRSQPADTDTTVAETQPQEAAVAEPTPKKVPVPQAQPKKTAAVKPSPVSALPARTTKTDVTAAKAATVEPAARVATVELMPKAAAVEGTVKTPEAMAKAPVAESANVTITGCLERNDDTYRLKDTTGASAPKGRSWRSGFLKKGSASIEIVDAADRLKLANHIGERVSVTGLLQDREMQVRSLQRIGASCNQSPA